MNLDWRRELLDALKVAHAMRVVPAFAIFIGVTALAVTCLNNPGQNERIAIVAIASVSGVGLVVRHWLTSVSAYLWVIAGGIAVAMTSREYFSFWPAGSIFLFLGATSRSKYGRHLVVAAAGATVGVVLAAFTHAGDVAPATLPVIVAAAAVLVTDSIAALFERARRLESEAQRLRERTAAAEMQTHELQRRTTLARELHDTLGHHISAMVLQAEAGQVAGSEAALVTIGDLGREALVELEDVLFDLRGPSTDSGRSSDVDLSRIDTKLAEPLRRRGVAVAVTLATTCQDLDVRWTIYRVVQEALTNVMRHSGAMHVAIEVIDDDQLIRLRITDDGIGIPEPLQGGIGLRGIAERVAQHGGNVTIGTGQPRGTVVEARLRRAAS